MAKYPYELEKGSKKFACPQCGRRSFKRVVATASGSRLPDNVGRCDHESSCGYEYTWKQYLSDNPDGRQRPDRFTEGRTDRRKRWKGRGVNRNQYVKHGWHSSSRKPDYLGLDHLLETIGGYEQNAFVSFLMGLFPTDPESVWQAVKNYRIGTKYGYCVFPTITKTGKVCKGKLIRYDATTGKRIKPSEDQYSTSSLEHFLKREGKIGADFETDKEVFFGEHLMSTHPDLPIAIVESEKSAVIGSICKDVFPDFVWLACGGKSNMKVERLARLGRNRKILLFPDADGYGRWQGIASDARKHGLSVAVSDLIEGLATDAERANGYDLADYLIRDQRKRNNPVTREIFRDLIEERLSIMTFDGRLTLDQAEAEIIANGFYQSAIRSVLEFS